MVLATEGVLIIRTPRERFPVLLLKAISDLQQTPSTLVVVSSVSSDVHVFSSLNVVCVDSERLLNFCDRRDIEDKSSVFILIFANTIEDLQRADKCATMQKIPMTVVVPPTLSDFRSSIAATEMDF
jgi:hypothetical protein